MIFALPWEMTNIFKKCLTILENIVKTWQSPTDDIKYNLNEQAQKAIEAIQQRAKEGGEND